jgi:hypothetical protein
MACTYEDDDRMLDRVMAEAAPGANKVLRKAFEVTGPDANGRFFAHVDEITYIAGMAPETDILECKWFGTRANADRWLNRHR